MGRREKRLNSQTFTQHVCLNGHNSKCIFREEKDRALFVEKIGTACKKYDVKLLAYTLMDNHVHLILLGDIEQFKFVFESIGASFARKMNEKYGDKGAFWEERYYNKEINTREQFLRTVAYIFNNPVGAGIVRHPKDYEWSNFTSLRDRCFDEEAENIIDELVNLTHLISYTIAAAKQKISAKEARALELIAGRRVRDADLLELLKAESVDTGASFMALNEKRRRRIVQKMWELGASINQIARVVGTSRYFINKTAASL